MKALGYDRHKLVVQVGSRGLGLSFGLSMHDWASQSGRTRCIEADAERLALLQQASSTFTTVLGLLPMFAREAHSLALYAMMELDYFPAADPDRPCLGPAGRTV